MDQNSITDRLYKSSEIAVHRVNFHFSSGAQEVLKHTAFRAAEEILRFQECTKIVLEGLVKNGELVFEEITWQSIEVTRKKAPEARAIEQSILKDVLLRFCPLWPIC